MTKEYSADVVIAGAGPVGLGLAIDLAQRGKSVVVLERTQQLHRIPKGQNLTQRTGEHFRSWGISEQVRAASPIPPEFGNAGLVTYGQLLSEYHCDWFQRAKVRPYYFADNERLPQYELERVMRVRAAELPNIQLLAGVQVTDVKQHANGVRMVARSLNDEDSIEVSAAYAVGCDGARSAVREAVGITQSVDHQGPKMVLLVFRSRELDALLKRYPGKTIFNVMNPKLGGYWQFFGRVDLDGGWFYHAPVANDTTRDNFDFTQYLHEVVGTPFALEFEHIGFWDLRISIADQYRQGRVFIAGDAAHSHPPYGGYGVNTGFEDAANLAWKLNAALEGWAGDQLLDSYSTERLPVFKSVAQDFIERMIDDFAGFCAQHDPEVDALAFRSAWDQRAQADDVDVTEFLPNYAGSPIVWGLPESKSGARGQHQFQARAGFHLAPPQGPDAVDLWSHIGREFVLLDFTDDASTARAFASAGQALGIPLRVHRQASASLQGAYGAGQILLRPDLFVAWTSEMDIGAQVALAKAAGY